MSPDFALDIVFGAAPDVTAGVVSGAVGGVTAGVVLKLLDWLASRYWFRRNQIRYLRNLLTRERDNIYGFRTIPGSNPQEPDLPAEQGRWAIYRYMKSEVDCALQERPTYMTYEQRRAIEKAFIPFNLVERHGRTVRLQGYRQLFNALEELAWLGLSPKQPNADAEE